jgi:uncharacterized membrane protein YraQ (UPF0718 family)
MRDALDAVGHALSVAGGMTWQITWSLILGFTLAAIVQAVVSRQTVVDKLGDSRPKTLLVASGLGVASSSCSYAAVALARSLFRKGASFSAAMTLEIASTNLVVELGIIMALLLGWQFVGGPVMIVLLAFLFRRFLTRRLLASAYEQANRGVAGSMEGHAAMDMSVGGPGSAWSRLFSPAGYTSVAHIFGMEWAAVLRDIVIGLLVAGAAGAWVPESWWQHFFFTQHPVGAKVWGPVAGVLVAVLSSTCSIGNVPLAAVLWNGGISFGGVIAFIFADLIIIPILVIYRKYYGARMTVFIVATFGIAMLAAAYLIELVFGALGLVPDTRTAKVVEAHIGWDYTTVLNILFLALAALLAIRFVRTGGMPMLKAMGGGPDDGHDHHAHDVQDAHHD